MITKRKYLFKKSFLLLEVLISIFFLSIIFLTSTKVLLSITQKNNSSYMINLTKIEFETTKLFLQNTLKKENDLNKIKYINNKLFYDNFLLQNHITSFNISSNNTVHHIDICIELYENICQTWVIK